MKFTKYMQWATGVNVIKAWFWWIYGGLWRNKKVCEKLVWLQFYYQ